MGKKPEEQQKTYQWKDDIGVYEFVQIILKRKKLIIGIFLIAIITAIAVSHSTKNVYRVSAIIEPGQIYELEKVRDTLILREKNIDTPENIERLISQNPFHYAILTQLGWDYEDPKSRFEINTNIRQKTNYISVSIDSTEPERAIEYLNALLVQLQIFYQPKIEANVTILNSEKKRIMNGKQSVNNKIEFVRSKLKILDTQSTRLQKQIEEIKNNKEQIIKQRDTVLAKGYNPEDAMLLLLYSNTIQENLTQIDRLNLALEDNAIRRLELQQDMKDLETQLINFDLQLADIDVKLANFGVRVENLDLQDSKLALKQKDINVQKANMSGIKVIQEPITAPGPISPKRYPMVVVAGVLGLFVGVFVACAIEFWQSYKIAA